MRSEREHDRKDDGSPDWVRDALRQFVDELRLFFVTAWHITTEPRAFARGWTTGQTHALNPLGFMGTSFAAVSIIMLVLNHLRGRSDDSEPQSLLMQALVVVGPYAYWLLFGAQQHYTLRLFGLRRPLRDAWAMALYTGGGPVAAMTLLLVILFAPAMHGSPSPALRTFVAVVLVICYSASIWILGRSLAGLHGETRWYHLFAANATALIVSGFVMGLGPPGFYGLHFHWQVTRDATGLGVHYGLSGG